MVKPEDVLGFWFPPGLALDEATHLRQWQWWFRGGADGAILEAFIPTLEAASRAELDAWAAAPESRLALILVLDQFSRTVYRGYRDGSANAVRRDEGQVREASQEAAVQAFRTGRSSPGVGRGTPIELFLIQALAKEKIFPESQMLIMQDGATFPSWYHLWQDIEFRHSDGLVTEADLYFPGQRVAVFCDGAHHSRGKQKAKDAAINAKLEAVGIRPVRIPSSEINFDLPKAVSRVTDALA